MSSRRAKNNLGIYDNSRLPHTERAQNSGENNGKSCKIDIYPIFKCIIYLVSVIGGILPIIFNGAFHKKT
jgi:hypothetical protein